MSQAKALLLGNTPRIRFSVQDTWQVHDMVEVTFGVRYEQFQQSDQPAFSNDVYGTFGERTDWNIDGKRLFMPRLSFRTTALDQWVFSGGYGLFSGGDPKVWTSNVFQVPTTFARISRANERKSDGDSAGTSGSRSEFLKAHQSMCLIRISEYHRIGSHRYELSTSIDRQTS